MRTLHIVSLLLLVLSVSTQDIPSRSPCQKVQALGSVILNKLVICEDLKETSHEDTVSTWELVVLERNKRSENTTTTAAQEFVQEAGRVTAKIAKGYIAAVVLAVTGWLCCFMVSFGTAFYHYMMSWRMREAQDAQNQAATPAK